MAKQPAKPLALTLGEPAGIGPDITIAAWLKRRELDLPAFYLLGDEALIARRAKALGAAVRIASVTTGEAEAAFPQALPVVASGEPASAAPGKPDASSAPAALASIRQAVTDVREGRAGAVVTNPIAKSVLYRAGFRHPGHTEFLAELAAEDGPTPQPVMMLWSPRLAVVPVTIHVSLRDALAQLTSELIVSTVRIVATELKSRFGIDRTQIPLRHRESAHRDFRPQSARGRGRLARPRGADRDRAGDQDVAGRRYRGEGTAPRRHHVPRSRAKQL